jgi:HEPN domain-containing protein
MEIYEEWFYKANSDLESAKVLMNNNLLDTAIYHTQQSAEKALKGFLVFHNQAIQRTHDLVILLDLCKNFDNAFEELRLQAITLNEFDTAFRYPNADLNPERSEVQTAINYAEVIFEFVKQKVQ